MASARTGTSAALDRRQPETARHGGEGRTGRVVVYPPQVYLRQEAQERKKKGNVNHHLQRQRRASPSLPSCALLGVRWRTPQGRVPGLDLVCLRLLNNPPIISSHPFQHPRVPGTRTATYTTPHASTATATSMASGPYKMGL